jgi:uncharacterized integral membrane protein
MRVRSVVLIVLLVLIALFAALNWAVISQNTALDLGVMQVQGPLGVVLLGFTALIAVAFVVYVLYMQTGMLFEARRQSKEMEQQRSLADQAELSRFTELRAYMQGELLNADKRNEEQQARLLARLDRLEANLATHIEQLLQK